MKIDNMTPFEVAFQATGGVISAIFTAAAFGTLFLALILHND